MPKHTPYSPGDPIRSSYTNDDIDGLSTGDNDTDNNSLQLFRSEAFDPFFKGATWSLNSGLVGTMLSGVLYYGGNRIPLNAIGSKTFSASQETYVDFSSSGVVKYTAVSVGADAPELDAGYTRNAIITTDGSTIIKITQKDRDSEGNLIYNSKPVARESSAPRVSLITTASSVTADTTNHDIVAVTALDTGLTINSPAGSPANGQALMFRIKDNGTSRSLTWNGVFRSIGVTIPNATSASKTMYIACRWNSQDSKWDILAVGRE